jgi:predicted RNA-binding protein YlxR (DUF448 family)
MRRKKTKISHSRPAAVKDAPQRTCVACRRVKPKRELVRLVRNPGGDVEIDTTGKKNGRGAYLCPDAGCWEKAMKGNQLEHALKSNMTEENREQIIRQAAALLKGVK